MRVPQEIVDAIIDYFGVQLDLLERHDPIFYRWDLDRSALNSWALVSKACNHRARYYLFSHCKIIATPPFLQTFSECPDVLLTYTRFLYICKPHTSMDLQPIIARFASSPLVRVTFVSVRILAGCPAVFGSFLPNVRRVRFEGCLFDPIALVELRGHQGLREVAVDNCYANGIMESVGDIWAGIPRRLADGIGGVNEVSESVLRPLRALRLESTADQSENELIKACAKSLQFLEVKTNGDWSSSSFRLDVGTCSKLQIITFEGRSNPTSTVNNLIVLLSTLRNPPKLSRIRVITSNFSFLNSDMHSPSEPEVWRRLDGLLCGLCPQTRKEDNHKLTFQIASRKAIFPPVPTGYLPDLLPEFCRVGMCEEVEFKF